MDIAVLAALAGNALVTAAVTDVWEEVRQKVARWFGRGQPDPLIQRRLDETRQALAAAAPAELEQAKAAQAVRWETRFSDLLVDHPEAAEDLAALVAEIGSMHPGGAVLASGQSLAAGGDISIQATGGSIAAGGNVTAVGPTAPGPGGR